MQFSPRIGRRRRRRTEGFDDERGFFMERFINRASPSGHRLEFVQDNPLAIGAGVPPRTALQISHPQGKLVRVIRGSVLDVAVDLRKSSPTSAAGTVASSAKQPAQVYVPEDLPRLLRHHSDIAESYYNAPKIYAPKDERTLLWNDPALGHQLAGPAPTISEKDQRGVPLDRAECFL